MKFKVGDLVRIRCPKSWPSKTIREYEGREARIHSYNNRPWNGFSGCYLLAGTVCGWAEDWLEPVQVDLKQHISYSLLNNLKIEVPK